MEDFDENFPHHKRQKALNDKTSDEFNGSNSDLKLKLGNVQRELSKFKNQDLNPHNLKNEIFTDTLLFSEIEGYRLVQNSL